MKNVFLMCLLGFAVAFSSGCGDSDSDGEECIKGSTGCPCIDGERCDFGLACENNVCVESSEDSATEIDTGTSNPPDSDSEDPIPTDPDSDTFDTGDGGVDEWDAGADEACHEDVEDWDPSFATAEEAFLSAVNQKRAQGATCNTTPYDPVPALILHSELQCANRFLVFDMHDRNYAPNEPDKLALCELGATATERAQSAGFTGTFEGWGAMKSQNPDRAVAATAVDVFMGIEVHCKNLMKAGTKYLGVGYATYPTGTADQDDYLWGYSTGH